MDTATCRARMSAARVARLATADSDGRPHVVPVTFTVHDDEIVFAIDQKPKRTTDLRRLRNIAENPRVAMLVDQYDDDWSQLWWVRADGRAAITRDPRRRTVALEALAGKYPQYRLDPPRGPVVVVAVETWSGWSFRS